MYKIIRQPEVLKEPYRIEIISPEKDKEEEKSLESEPLSVSQNLCDISQSVSEASSLLSQIQSRYEGLQIKYNLLVEEFEKTKKEYEEKEEKLKHLTEQVKNYNNMLLKIKTEVETIEKEAKDRGYAAGYQIGKEEGIASGKKELLEMMKDVAAEINTTEKLLHQIIEDAKKEKEKFLEKNEEEILELVLSCAKKIVGEEIKLNREVILSVLRQASEKIKERDRITLRVNPEDLKTLSQLKEKILYLENKVSEIKYVPDESIKKGGLIIETSSGVIDATLDSRINEIEKALT